MKNDIETLQAALANLEALDPEAEAASCIEAARRFASMRRVTFDARLAGLMSEADNDGEQEALEAIRQAGHRQLARVFLEEARGWAPGGRLRSAMAELIEDLRHRLASR